MHPDSLLRLCKSLILLSMPLLCVVVVVILATRVDLIRTHNVLAHLAMLRHFRTTRPGSYLLLYRL